MEQEMCYANSDRKSNELVWKIVESIIWVWNVTSVVLICGPGTTATHHLLPLTPITIKPPTTATTYYDGWWRWWVSMVDVSLQLHWVAVWSHQALTQTTTCYHYQPNHLSHHLLWWLAAIWTLPLNLHERIMGKLVIQGLQYQ